jgi:hypothetical protein
MEFIKSFIRKIIAIVKHGASIALEVIAGPAVEIYNTKKVTHWNVVGLIARVVFFASMVIAMPAFLVALATWYMGWVIGLWNVVFCMGVFAIIVSDDKALDIEKFKFKYNFTKAAKEFTAEVSPTAA